MFPILLANLVTQVLAPRTPPRRTRRPGRVRKRRGKPINLGLQGGGAHGAFTWGVLDQLLDDGRLEIEGISGASAGAVNAVMLADGLARGGADEARQRLADFWRAVSVDGHLPDLQRSVVERLFPFVPREGLWFGAMSRMLSPYDLNPLNINPLKDVIDRFVDFEAIRDNRELELFVSATNVHTGELRIFDRAEVTPEVVMASAALPLLFRAVEIDGAPYWDGGYSGNPAVIPFLRTTATEDVLVIQINPRERRKVPTSTREIMSRVNEINFNASLLSELRGVAFVNRLIDEGRLPRGTREGEFRRLKLHRIVMEDLGDTFGRAARSRPTTNISRPCASSASGDPTLPRQAFQRYRAPEHDRYRGQDRGRAGGDLSYSADCPAVTRHCPRLGLVSGIFAGLTRQSILRAGSAHARHDGPAGRAHA
ncbi:MAG: patatin-like phospholipase family protein, partial [Xanthobacteraceae bacterium]